MATTVPPGTRETNQNKPYGVYDRTPTKPKTNWVWIALLALLAIVLLFFWMS